jgi:DNA mismatch repair protein MutL
VVELGPTDLEIVLSARESLAALGLLVEPFGEDAIAVNGIPAAAGDAEPSALVEGVLESLAEDRPAERDALVERLLATLACHAAVKAGDPLDRRRVADLLVEAEGEEHAATCPHGRPTTLRIGYDQLERHFRRRGGASPRRRDS